MPTSHSSGCGCHGTGSRVGRAPLAATLPSPAVRTDPTGHDGHTEHTDAISLGGAVPPMELLGGGGGMTVVDPASVLTRLWWFDGRFLRAEGFRLDQEYVRSLVALSNQAVGSGVVHGFDADLVGSTTIRVEGGLALAPSGRVVHLPSTRDLPIAELVARSTGRFDPAASAADRATGHGVDFAPCPPDNPAGPDQPVSPMALFVLTVASAEALCGEEERFGQLCGDACASDADRSVAVEGVRFRLRPITLGLPSSTRVPFSSRHLRSRAASAYYAAERRAVASMISGAGLRQPVWCDGAEPVGGEEVALALLDRAGGLTTFVDAWTARRELVETSPQRYWQWRMAMRPLDVFLAQVLQFQCQLADVPADGVPTPGTDPCASERTVLGDVHALLGDLGEGPSEHDDVLARLRELRGRVTDVLAGTRLSPSGSLLIDHGIVETPAAGYLPVDPAHDVRAQVGAWFGPGVDLRFCAVRPDFVPEAFQEAQHMERISLTRGVDDPKALEEVDVLVPGGTFARTTTDRAFTGRVDLLPLLLGGNLAHVGSAALSLSAVARNQVATGWSWTLAAYGEAPERLGIKDYARAMSTVVTAPDEAEVDVHREPAARLGDYRSDTTARVLREGSLARARAGRLFDAAGDPVAQPGVEDHAVEPDERRPMVAWVDLETALPLDQLDVGAATSLRGRVVTYSRARAPSMTDVALSGTLVVKSRQVEPASTGGTVVSIVTALEGVIEVTDNGTSEGPRNLSGSSVVWRLERTPAGDQVLAADVSLQVDAGGEALVISAAFSDRGTPRTIEGRVGRGTTAGAFRAAMLESVSLKSPIAALSLEEGEGVLALGTPGRDLATSVIDVLGTALAAVRGDVGFREQARRRLLPESATSDVLTTQADWVMFHRRRVRDCEGAVATSQPTRLLRYRWLHAVAVSPEVVERERERVRAASEPADLLALLLKRYPPQPVALVEFEETATAIHSSVPDLRAAWSATDRGARLPLSFTARWGSGDGSTVEGGRLGAAVAAVSDLIDTSSNRAFVLAQAPVDLESEGTDGLFVTFGVGVVHSVSLILDVNQDQRERLRVMLPNSPDAEQLKRILEELGLEPFLMKFADDDLENPDDLRGWWAGRQVEAVEVVYDRAMPPGSAEATQWAERKYPGVADALGLPAQPDVVPDVVIDLGGAEALLLVTTFDL